MHVQLSVTTGLDCHAICCPVGFRCVDCGYNCHEKCRPLVPKNCHEVINFDIRESGAAASADGDDSDMVPVASK